MKDKKVIVPLDEMVKTVLKAVVMDAEKYLLSQGLEKEVIRDMRQITKILLQQQTLPIKKFVVMNGIDENTVLPINQIAYLKANGSYTEVCAGMVGFICIAPYSILRCHSCKETDANSL